MKGVQMKNWLRRRGVFLRSTNFTCPRYHASRVPTPVGLLSCCENGGSRIDSLAFSHPHSSSSHILTHSRSPSRILTSLAAARLALLACLLAALAPTVRVASRPNSVLFYLSPCIERLCFPRLPSPVSRLPLPLPFLLIRLPVVATSSRLATDLRPRATGTRHGSTLPPTALDRRRLTDCLPSALWSPTRNCVLLSVRFLLFPTFYVCFPR